MSKTIAATVARRQKGFEPASRLIQNQIKQFGRTYGFSQSQLLTRWDTIVGDDIAALGHPIKITRTSKFGATLKLLTTGAMAPVLSMHTEKIRDRVNQFYGYDAIARVTITQSAPEGFHETQAPYTPPSPRKREKKPKNIAQMTACVKDIENSGLRAALENLGECIAQKDLTLNQSNKSKKTS